ncbi:MAG: pentapeptide repeat-containing protein [Pseudonocardiaceae bacterium]
MNSRGKPPAHRPARPLSNRAIALGAVIVLGIGAVAWTVLLWRYTGAGAGVELDTIRTAGTLIVGAGGFAALLLAARRQRSTELTLEHQREVAQANERDAAEQRLTELYTRAVDQLGAEKAPVRLGGLHALERLAQNNATQRQTVVDVICAYLRMPYTPPGDQAPGEDAPEDAHRRYEQRRQELQVRMTAQRVLGAHLKPAVAPTFWADIDLDLTEAHLHQLDLTRCHIRRAQFDGATFAGDARFEQAEFSRTRGSRRGLLVLTGARFRVSPRR